MIVAVDGGGVRAVFSAEQASFCLTQVPQVKSSKRQEHTAETGAERWYAVCAEIYHEQPKYLTLNAWLSAEAGTRKQYGSPPYSIGDTRILT